MNVLLLGSGGREHAIASKLADSPLLSKLWAAPGNVGIESRGETLDVSLTNLPEVTRLAERVAADLVVVGPEDPLAAGISDHLEAAGFRVFGPSARAAQIEASKSFANRLMARAGIATARSESFDDPGRARDYVRSQPGPVVIKADGLAAGKGVTVCRDEAEALTAIERAMVTGAFGDAGRRVVIEERLFGPETSAHAFTDGTTVRHMPFSCDHKPALDGDQGPNTGGMGAYCPPPWLADETTQAIRTDVTERVVAAMAEAGSPYRGVIYPGLMITAQGPRVIEFNSRFGDPETEVVLPKLRTDLLAICLAVSEGRLAEVEVDWDADATVGVVMTSGGYPGSYETGFPITGLDAVESDVDVFIAGARRDERGQMVTAGGRVLCVVGSGSSVSEARERAYENVARISFHGAHYRRDIGRAGDERREL